MFPYVENEKPEAISFKPGCQACPVDWEVYLPPEMRMYEVKEESPPNPTH